MGSIVVVAIAIASVAAPARARCSAGADPLPGDGEAQEREQEAEGGEADRGHAPSADSSASELASVHSEAPGAEHARHRRVALADHGSAIAWAIDRSAA